MQYLSPKVLEAFEFAAVAHHKQKRKYTEHIPYISHSLAVALVLAKAGFSDDVVIAGALHDVIEDIEYTEHDIRQRFGNLVAELVLGVTENKNLPWKDRKKAYNEHLKIADEETLAISASDLLANRTSFLLMVESGVNLADVLDYLPGEILNFSDERISILKQRLHHPLTAELQRTEQQVRAHLS